MFRKIRALLFLSSAALLLAAASMPLPSPASAGEGPADGDALLRKVGERYAAVRTFSARFRQEIPLQNVGIVRHASGKLYFGRPLKMRWDYDAPENQLFLADGENFYFRPTGSPEVIRRKIDEKSLGGKIPLLLLFGKGDLAEMFRVEAAASPERGAETMLRLVPRGEGDAGDPADRPRRGNAQPPHPGGPSLRPPRRGKPPLPVGHRAGPGAPRRHLPVPQGPRRPGGGRLTRAARVAGTVRIHTLGCGKNAVDSEVMAGLLAEKGFALVPGGRADVAVLNTCGFVRAAKEESIEEILALAREKRRGRIRLLVVAGCLARRYPDDLPGLLPEVDLFLGPGDIPALPGLLAGMLAGEGPRDGAPRRVVGDGALPDAAYGHRLPSVAGGAAFLKILEGCDNRCSYCAIPAIRGPLRSRDRDSLLAEARRLVRSGAREINLIGQDLTAYGKDRAEKKALPSLVRDLCAIRGVRWVRLLYLYPGRVDDGIIGLLRSEEKVCPYLDIPVQHIDPRILSAMGRKYGPADVYRMLERLREAVPGIFLRTTLIAGFPGETPGAFDRLLRFVLETRWDYLGVFPYSREEGTAAASMPRQVPRKTAEARAQLIRDAQADILAARNAALVGETVEVLAEKILPRGGAAGRHRGQAPEVDGSVRLTGFTGKPGDICRARVTGSREWDLRAAAIPRSKIISESN
jgi:ribosomal protein S12 methylthiotransferase